MPPLRVALIGLSQSAKTSWAAEGHLPYLLSDRGRQKYRIAALLNSTEDAARRSIEHYNLPSDAKAYGSPQALAADPDVDLVVCSTRVDVHFDTIRPSVEAGKAVFVEWPLAENVSRAKELTALAAKSGSPTLIGLQGRVAPVVLKVKELLEAGTIGKVLSSEVKAATPGGGGDGISEGLSYFLDKKIGGNPITIALGHTIDFVHHVLGEFVTSNTHVQIQRPNQSIINRETGDKRPTQSDVPDLVSVHGALRPSSFVTAGASLFVSFRTGPPFPGTMPFVWTINGERGEIRVTSERGPFIQSEASAYPIRVEVADRATGDVKSVDWAWEGWQDPLPPRSRSVARLYDLYAEGGAKGRLPSFEDAVVRHAQVDEMLHPNL